MKKLLFLLLIGISTLGFSQDYEIVYHPKVKEAFTTENIDSLEIKFIELQHPTDTVYYNISEWTYVKIYPSGIIGVGLKEEEK